MCLSTVYNHSKNDDNVLCRFVEKITADGDKLILEDVMGRIVTVTGRLVEADLTAGSVIVAAD